MSKTSASLRRKAARAAWVERYITPPSRPGRVDWPAAAACIGTAPDEVTVHTCESCPVRLECIQDAYRTEANEPTHHVFLVRGGLPARVRAAALTQQRRQAARLADLHPLVVLVMEADNHVDVRNQSAVA